VTLTTASVPARRSAHAACVLALAASLSAAAAPPARDGAYPVRPIRLVTTSAAGGSSDVIARAVARHVESALGTSIVVDNRPGAAGIIGYDLVAKAVPDGYTLLHATAALVITPSIYRKLPFDVRRDFTPITSLGSAYGYLLIVHPALPATSLAEFVKLAGGRGSRLHYGSPGIGNPLHLAGATFNERTGSQLVHVAYKGMAPALNAVMSGEVQAMFAPPTVTLQHVKSGRVRALAFTGSARASQLPNVPTVAESGIAGFDISGSWHGWFAPARLPPEIVARLYEAVRRALDVPELAAFLRAGGYEPDGRPPSGFGRYIAAEHERYAREVRAAGVEPQ